MVNGKIIYYNDLILKNLQNRSYKLKKDIRYDRANSVKKVELRNVHKNIKQRISTLEADNIKNLTNEIQRNKLNRSSFIIQRMLCNTEKNKKLQIINEDGFIISEPKLLIPIVSTHYEAFFNQEGMSKVQPFIENPRPLNNPISTDEVSAACLKLNNYRSFGPDKEFAENYKYGGIRLHQEYSTMINNIFISNTFVESIGMGYLNVHNKPGKPLKVENTRPITAVTTKRKINN